MHEVAHGIADVFASGDIPVKGTRSGPGELVTLQNQLTGEANPVRKGTFEGEIAEILNVKGAEKNAIVKELVNLQDNVNYVMNDGSTLRVRDLKAVKDMFDQRKSQMPASWARK